MTTCSLDCANQMSAPDIKGQRALLAPAMLMIEDLYYLNVFYIMYNCLVKTVFSYEKCIISTH